MNRFGEIIGQQAARELLLRFLKTERIPQALVFQGPEGVGKATVATALASILLCEVGDGFSCGRCHSCQLLPTGNHPDCITITLQPKEGGKSGGKLAKDIVIDQVRELTRVAGTSPRLGRRRIFIIDPAERMNRNSQNAILKTLEEPTSRTMLILISSRPHLLVPTVRSRCIAVRFGQLHTDELTRLLEKRGVAAHEARRRALFSGGCPGRALSLDLDEIEAQRQGILKMLEQLSASTSAASELPAMAAKLAGKDEPVFLENLTMLQTLLRDALRSGLDGADHALVHADLAHRLTHLRDRLGPRRTAELIHGIDRLRGDLRFNLNRVLIAESLLAGACGAPLP